MGLFTYDARGNLNSSRFFGVAGMDAPVLNEEGYHLWSAKYDRNDLRTEVAVFGVDGVTQPVVKRRKGYHLWRTQHNGASDVTEVRYYGVGGTQDPVLRPDVGYHIWVGQYNRDGSLQQASFFGKKGLSQPVLRKHYNHHMWRGTYDSSGRLAEQRYYGEKGVKEPILVNDGYHLWTGVLDTRGNLVESRYFGLGGESDPVLRNWRNYHLIKTKYDMFGNAIERRYFGLGGSDEPISEDSENAHLVAKKFDVRGNKISESYFGLGGYSDPIVTSSGFHKSISKYDDLQNEIEVRYFGKKGENEPILNDSGFHLIKKRYADTGLEKSTRYFGLSNNPVDNFDGFHLTKINSYAIDDGSYANYFDVRGKQVNLYSEDEREGIFNKVDVLLESGKTEEAITTLEPLINDRFAAGQAYFKIAKSYYFELEDAQATDEFIKKGILSPFRFYSSDIADYATLGSFAAGDLGDSRLAGSLMLFALGMECLYSKCTGWAHENIDVLDETAIEKMQSELKVVSLYGSKIDGKLGSGTRSAIKNYINTICPRMTDRCLRTHVKRILQ